MLGKNDVFCGWVKWYVKINQALLVGMLFKSVIAKLPYNYQLVKEKFLILTVGLSTSLYCFIIFCFVYFEDLVLGT